MESTKALVKKSLPLIIAGCAVGVAIPKITWTVTTIGLGIDKLLFSNSMFGGLFITIVLAYAVVGSIIAGILWLALRQFAYKNLFAGGLFAAMTGLGLANVMDVVENITPIPVLVYVATAFLIAMVFVAVLLVAQRTQQWLAASLAAAAVIFLPLGSLEASTRLEDATSELYKSVQFNKTKTENRFDAYVAPGSTDAQFVYRFASIPHSYQYVPRDVGEGALGINIVETGDDIAKDLFVDPPSKCNIRGLYSEIDTLELGASDETSGCWQVATTSQGVPVYTESAEPHVKLTPTKLTYRYYYLQNGSTHIVIQTHLFGNMVGQDPAPYIDELMLVIDSLQKVDSSSLEARDF